MNSQLPNMKNLKVIVVVIVALLMASCTTSNQSAKPRVALVMKSLANEFFKTMQDGAAAHQQAHAADYELIANGIKDELDVARQVELVEQMIAQQVQASISITRPGAQASLPNCAEVEQMVIGN